MMLPLFLAQLSSEADRALFERIYMNYRKQMFAVARSYLPNDVDAEDAVHDVFLRVASTCWESVRKLENEPDLRSYLLKAAKHAALNTLNRREKKDLSLDDSLAEAELADPMQDGTFAAAVAQIEEKRLLDAIESLPEIYRDALYFRFVLRLSVGETAQTMGQSVFATKKQIQRGKQKLLALLKE